MIPRTGLSDSRYLLLAKQNKITTAGKEKVLSTKNMTVLLGFKNIMSKIYTFNFQGKLS